jgi:lysophospholipase L1-like esterase
MSLKSFSTLIQLLLLGGSSFAASLTVDESSAASNIGGSAAGSQGAVVLDPAGVLGWANYRASLTPSAGESGGAVAITASQIGAFTLSASVDTRFSQSWSGGADTNGVRGQSAAGMAAGEGFRISFIPGAIGNFTLMIHIADFNVDVDYAVTQGGNAVGSGAIAAFGAASTYDEGPVDFHFTVADAAEAAATWDFDITRSATGGGNALLLGGVSLTPADAVADNHTLVIEPTVTLATHNVSDSFQLPFSNGGTSGSLTISSVTPGGADAADFTIDSFDSPVDPGGSGTIDFTFTPSDGVREYTSTFTIASNDSVSSPAVIHLSVNVRPPPSVSLGKLVCIGDSITEGRATRPDGEGNWSWRSWCWENFVDFSIGHEFVGTRTSNKDGTSTYPPYQGQPFVNRHEAVWGTTFLERSNNVATYLNTLKSAGKTPDTAVIFGGGNDVPVDLSVSAATVRDRTKILVDHLQGDLGSAGNPNARILLVSILPRFTGANLDVPDFRNARYQEINDLLSTLAGTETTATSEVLFLDLQPLFADPPGLLYDGVHPNGAGEQLIGNAIFAALVPDMPAIQMRIESVDAGSNRVNFSVRSHGPRPVRMEDSPDLSPASWSVSIPSQLNPGEWSPMTLTESSALPTRRFYRAVAE